MSKRYSSEHVSFHQHHPKILTKVSELGDITDTALTNLLWYVAQGPFEDLVMDTVSPDEVSVKEMGFYHPPVLR